MYIYTFVNNLYKNQRRTIILSFYDSVFIDRMVDDMLVKGWTLIYNSNLGG